MQDHDDRGFATSVAYRVVHNANRGMMVCKSFGSLVTVSPIVSADLS